MRSPVRQALAALALAASLLSLQLVQAQPASAGVALNDGYRNWFADIGKSQSEVDARVESLYNAIFTENGPDDQRIYQTVGGDKAFIQATKESDVRSEGQSWGLMVALQMNDQTRFNKLWNFAKTYMQCPNVNTDCGGRYDSLFIWHVDDAAPYGHFYLSDGSPEYTPAPDGDIYFATALLMASHRWGNGSGIYNYASEAGWILNEMKDTSDLQPGELSIFNPDNKLARFIPTWIEGTGSLVDTSYQLPGFYEYWSRYDPNTGNRSYWNEAAGAARGYWANVIDRAGNRGNGIFPDCTKPDGGPLDNVSCANGYKYGSDGWRTIQNVAMDHYWWSGEPDDGHSPIQAQVDWANQFLGFMNNSRYDMDGEYWVDGTPAADWTGGAAQRLMTASAAMIATDSGIRNNFIQLAWDTPVTTGEWRYYHNSLHMLGMLHLSGKYRVWPSAGGGGNGGGGGGNAATVYGDGFADGWNGEGWNGDIDAANGWPVYGDSGHAIKVTPSGGYAALAVKRTAGALSTGSIGSIRLRVHGGDSGTRNLQVMTNPNTDGSGTWSNRVAINANAGTWTEFVVAKSDLGDPNQIGMIAVQDATGGTQPTFYVDDIRLT